MERAWQQSPGSAISGHSPRYGESTQQSAGGGLDLDQGFNDVRDTLQGVPVEK